jgi:transglutaminase-like putative cysteine protease
METYLSPTYFIDSNHPAVVAYTREVCGDEQDPLRCAVKLFYAIRDGWRYDPSVVSIKKEDLKASHVLSKDSGYCVEKALLLAACARAAGIPSRLHFANVTNHIGTERIEKVLGTHVLVFHGYTELWLQEQWVAATPAFNRSLCEKLGVMPLEFDGTHDAVFQEYDPQAGKFMEYLHDYGSFHDLPYELMVSEWRRYYPHLFRKLHNKEVMVLTDKNPELD